MCPASVLRAPEEPLQIHVNFSFAKMQQFSVSTLSLIQGGASMELDTYAELLRKRAADLEDELQAVRSCTNTLSLTNRLPAELLARIFLKHAEAVAETWEDSKKLGWIKICHVCQRWRTVALGYAPLWSRISFAHPELMKLLLSRSKGAPLDITIHPRWMDDRSLVRETLADIMSHTTRLRSVNLKISSSGQHRFKDVLSKASGRAPMLRELTLSDPDPPLRFAVIPSDFLQGGAPALRALVLDQVNIPWKRLPLSATLTRLNLTRCFERPSVSEFYESLSKLTLLEDLQLSHRWIPEPGYSTIPSPTVPTPLTLPSLKTIKVEDWSDVVRDFFGVIRLPMIVSTQVKLCDYLPRMALVDRCLRKVRISIGDAMKGFPEVRRLKIQGFHPDPENFEEDPSFHMSFTNPPVEPEDPRFNVVVRITDRSPDTLPLPEVLALVDKIFDLSTIRTLELPETSQIHRHADFYDLHDMGQDPALKTRARGDRSRPKPYFPSLSSLSLSFVDFKEDGVATDDNLERITDALGKRPKAHRIKCFQLKLCRNFGEDELEKLNQLLPKVEIEWDWYEDRDEGTDEDADADGS
ncbi:hypothetical protein NMY22_g11801 [Coprinellus aureogranulatus]|nr:hypothetical protein NMY22_g11801 [Coprinellus aureogranulatus]